MTNQPLSPAAQAVMDATDYPEDWATRIRVAASLRAAVEQVLPEEPRPVPSRVEPGGTHMYHHERMARWEERQQSRREFLAIAAELQNES